MTTLPERISTRLTSPTLHLSLGAALLLVPPAFFELALWTSWPAWFYGAYAAVTALFLWALSRGTIPTVPGVLGTYTLILAVLWLVPWSSRKVFLQDLARVEPGMSRAQVEEILGGYLHGTGWPANPFWSSNESPSGELEIQGAQVFRHSNDGRFNADWAVVHFKEGRVASVEFLYD